MRRFGILHVCCCDGGGWWKTFVMVMALRIYLVRIGMNRDAEI